MGNHIPSIDGSLNAKANLNTGFVYKTSAYTVEASCNGFIIEASGTFTLTFPNSLATGFQSTIVNIGGGNITLNASTMLTTDSSVVLRDRYAGASVVHKGSGAFYGWGNLK